MAEAPVLLRADYDDETSATVITIQRADQPDAVIAQLHLNPEQAQQFYAGRAVLLAVNERGDDA